MIGFLSTYRRFFQHFVPNVGVDIRRGLVVRVADDLHRPSTLFPRMPPNFAQIDPLGKQRILVRL